MDRGTGTIRLRDALRLMDHLDHKQQPRPFDIAFYTADRRRNTGGEYRHYTGCILSKHNKFLPLHMRRVDGFGGSKSPNHYANATRNIQTPDGDIHKVHIRLIKQFNGMTIIW